MNKDRGIGLGHPLVVAAAVAAVIGGVLLLQHQRHGWPFSLHHDAAVAAPQAAAGEIPSPVGDERPSHGRVAVTLDPVRLSAAGLRIEAARVEALARSISAVATVVPDEQRIWHAHTRVAGWIEELHVATTGQAVRAGQPLAAVFSQELYASQLEYLAALEQSRAGPRSAVVDSARARLKTLGMTEAEIAGIERSGEARRRVSVAAARDGVVLRRAVSVGTAVDPSTELLTLADLSSVWVLAELPEHAAAAVAPGMPVVLEFAAAGLPAFEAPVDFIYPTLSERTRSLRVRFAVANPRGVLRPGQYGNALFRGVSRTMLTVPRDAVVDTGDMQHVFVTSGDARFEPRPVRTGLRTTERIEIVDGLVEGETVVVSGVFLIDSESRLRSGGGAGHAGHGSATPAIERDDAHTGHTP
jgi:membrane fusion protein, copper/silver efflux system